MKYRKLPNKEYLNKILDYNKDSGVFTWKKSLDKSSKAGQSAGTVNEYGYITIRIDGIRYRAHRLAWYMTTGSEPYDQIDHINQNKSDNRFCNLRQANASQNSGNTNARSHSKTGVRGVSPHRGKFRACIKIRGVTKHLGSFESIDDAEAAYKKASNEYYGDYSVYKSSIEGKSCQP